MNELEMIAAFSNAFGPSGFEDEVLEVARRYAPKDARIEEDSLRNLYIHRAANTGGRPVVQLDAHSDEVGFMVQAIRPNGTLAFLPVGGWNPANVPSSKVRVRSVTGEWIPGIVAAKPVHFMSAAERGKPQEFSDMSIDIGAVSAKEAEEDFGIRVAAPVVPDVMCEYDAARGLFLGKAFDCRVGCAAVLDALHRMAGQDLACDVEATLTSQEEVGERGASAAAGRMRRADVCVLFEGCPADDTVVEPYMVQTALRKGPMLRFIDRRMITHPRFQRFALDLGERLGIPVQSGVRSGGSTNGAPIHLSNLGVPCIVVGVPVRYIHTQYGIATYADLENAAKLAAAVVRALNADVIAGF